MDDFPLPSMGTPVVAVPAPGTGEGWWAGSSSPALDDDGSFVIAYRVRTGAAGRGSTVVARSASPTRRWSCSRTGTGCEICSAWTSGTSARFVALAVARSACFRPMPEQATFNLDALQRPSSASRS